MSSTNVHSSDKEINNPCCAGGQTIPDENERITVPPTAAKEGPSIEEVRNSVIMTLDVYDGEIREDGKLVQDGKTIADFGIEAYKELKEKHNSKETDKVDVKGEDR